MTKILLIDDDQDFLDSMRLTLENARFEVDTALTPEQGIEKAASGEHDIIVLDVMMPNGYEGFEVARTIREKLNLRDVPIIILSSIHQTKHIPYRFAPDDNYLPVDVFLDKPVDAERLLATIEEMIGERREKPEQPL
ncbi:MAG: response regulator [Phycisphaerales bacterium]|nr:response regulator [Phycisphaerales bacterium]